MIHIRIATSTDANAIAQLHAQSWRNVYKGILSDHYLQNGLINDRMTDWRQRFTQPAVNQHVIVAEDDQGRLLGFACAYGNCEPDVGTLVENLHAHPEHKKNGVGRLMLQHMATWNQQHYPQALLHLWVVKANAAAIGFYQHMGARQDKEAIWDAPDGTSVEELRYTWFQPEQLIADITPTKAD